MQTLGSNPVQIQIAIWRIISTKTYTISFKAGILHVIKQRARTRTENGPTRSEKPVFAHGHLYVGLSRVREATNIAIFTTKDSLLIGSRLGTAEDGDILPVTTTVIYPELLLPTNISTDQGGDDDEVLDRSMMLIASDYN